MSEKLPEGFYRLDGYHPEGRWVVRLKDICAVSGVVSYVNERAIFRIGLSAANSPMAFEFQTRSAAEESRKKLLAAMGGRP